jgi:hypothetical protein
MKVKKNKVRKINKNLFFKDKIGNKKKVKEKKKA